MTAVSELDTAAGNCSEQAPWRDPAAGRTIAEEDASHWSLHSGDPPPQRVPVRRSTVADEEANRLPAFAVSARSPSSEDMLPE